LSEPTLIPTLDYAGSIARSGVRFQEDKTDLTISMRAPRWKYLSERKKLILVIGVWFLCVGMNLGWMFYGAGTIGFAVTAIVTFTRRVTFRVDDKSFRVGARIWPLANVAGVKRVPENLGFAVTADGDSFDVDCGNEQDVLEWVAAKLNQAICARQAKPSAAPAALGGSS
jgi:hypothetical protein